MKEIRLTRTFLKKPMNSLLILLSILLLIEAVSWSVGYNIKIERVNKVGGFLAYIVMMFSVQLIPELCTLFITIFLINCFHTWFNLRAVDNSWPAIGRYELRLLPVIAFAFLVYNPVTQTVRYLLEQFPTYSSFSDYWRAYIVDTFTWTVYFQYLIPVLLISYIAINISLFKDFLQQRREAQEAAEAKAIEAEQAAMKAAQAAQVAQAALAKSATSRKSAYLAHLKGKSRYGELDFPVSDAYYFTIEERCYYAELPKGRYQIIKTINELEAELDPSQFFRVKRDYVVNRQAVISYSYWENGKYIVRLNTPDRYEIIVPRARMQVFREWLQGLNQNQPLVNDEGLADSVLVKA